MQNLKVLAAFAVEWVVKARCCQASTLQMPLALHTAVRGKSLQYGRMYSSFYSSAVSQVSIPEVAVTTQL